MKIFVLGLDGASYLLINKFLEEGKLPNFKKVIDNGIFTELISSIPPHTAPGWVSAFTGVQAGKHGIYQFWDTQSSKYIGDYMGRNQYGVLPVWDILNDFGFKTGMVNIPMTHPPKEVDGFIMTWPLSNTLKYTYPKGLLHEIAKVKGHYATDINFMYKDDERYIDKALEVTNKRLVTIKYLMENKEWDLFVSVFTEIDRVSHYYWNYMDTKSPWYIETLDESLKNAIENIYIETDKILGQLMDLLSEDTLLMIMSDHGFDKCEHDFYVQSYLHEIAMLHIKPFDELKDCERDQYASSWYKCEYNNKDYVVDWSKTLAYMPCPGSYGVNVNLKGRQEQGVVDELEYENVRDKLIKKLSSIRHPDINTLLFKKVVKREEVYKGEKLKEAPDIIMIPHHYSTMVHHKLIPGKLFGCPEQKGVHDRNGILMLYGKEIKQLDVDRSIHLEDIAPTILDCFGIEKAKYMDGESVIKFTNDSELLHWERQNEIVKEEETAQAYSNAEKAEIEEKLKLLGYL